MEFRDDKVVRERIYFGEPWEPPAWPGTVGRANGRVRVALKLVNVLNEPTHHLGQGQGV